MNPITSATVSGLGQSPLGAVEGTWVVGFFQDGPDAQQPIIIGTLPGVPTELPTKISSSGGEFAGKGFQDYLNAAYPKYKEETDVNRLAVNDLNLPHSTLTIREADRTTDIGRADFNEVQAFMSELDNQDIPGDDGTSFSEPAVPYDAEYPYNHVYESEAGHIREIDDTPTKERIHERHASGTGYEIHPDGSKVTRVKKDNYDLVTGDNYAHIKGNSSTTTDGGIRVFVNANASTDDSHYTIEVGNDANVNIQVNKGDVNVVTTEGDINLKSGRNINMQTLGFRLQAQTVDISVAGQWTETTKDKTESTTEHLMDAKNQTITATNTVLIDGSSNVDIDGGIIELN
tara:strand:+ start:110 stop:1144 length:1035 start_codon:yes stop_codon:yes gene_type:complete